MFVSIAALVAVRWAQGAPQPPATPPPTAVETFNWSGKKFSLRIPSFPETVSTEAPRIAFDGKSLALGSNGLPLYRFEGNGGYPMLDAAYQAAKAKWTATTPVSHIKVFLVTKTEILWPDQDGLFHQRTSSIGPRDQDRILSQIAWFHVAANAAFGGSKKVVVDVEIDSDLHPATTEKEKPFGPAWASRLVELRTNYGGFDAEDRLFRGPYDEVFVLHSGLTSPNEETFVARGKRGYIAPVYTHPMWLAESGITGSLLMTWARDTAGGTGGWINQGSINVAYSRAAGLLQSKTAPSQPNPSSKQTLLPIEAAEWAAANLSQVKPTFDEDGLPALAVDLTPAERAKFPAVQVPPPASVATWTWTVGPGPEPDAISITELGNTRSGRMLASTASEGRKPFLEFKVRSTSRDPIAVRVDGLSKPIEVVVGVNYPLPPFEDSRGLEVIPVSFTPNGQWQTIRVDLSSYWPEGNTSAFATIAAPTYAKLHDKVEFAAINYDFGAIKFLDKATGDLTPNKPYELEEEVLAKETLTADTGKLIKLLNERSPVVVLNALIRLQQKPDPSAMSMLDKLANSVNHRISELAMRNLLRLGSNEAQILVREMVTHGAYPHVRANAAAALAPLGDENFAGLVSTLWASPSWHARLTAVEVLGTLPGTQTPLMLATFLNQREPEVRLRVIQLMNLENDTLVRRMLWTAINDPCDAIRLTAALKLFDVKDPAIRADAYKAATDDSFEVRSTVMAKLVTLGDEAARPIYRQVVTDTLASMRALALDGFAALSSPTMVEEIQNVLDDGDEQVQLALVRLALKKRTTLPAEVVSKLKASTHKSVREAAAAL
ncbi:MAG: hypothetical protein JST35_11445 [Armatimonadetes bacterium]|nr:hypothetical protein [Armatimonadota bacterium]